MPERTASVPHDPHHTRLANLLMRRQAALSFRVALVFLALVFGVPVLNQFAPDVGQAPVLGFPLSWLLLGLLFYPLTWALSAYFVRASEAMEAADAVLVREELAGGDPGR